MKIGKEFWDAMLSVFSGDDVFDPDIANKLRFVEINHPEFIVIGHFFRQYPEGEEQPIFGAMLTRVGKDYLNKRLDEEYEILRNQRRDEG